MRYKNAAKQALQWHNRQFTSFHWQKLSFLRNCTLTYSGQAYCIDKNNYILLKWPIVMSAAKACPLRIMPLFVHVYKWHLTLRISHFKEHILIIFGT